MRILAFDSSGERLSVALADGDRIVAEYTAEALPRSSDTLMPAIERLMKKARWKPEKLDAIAVCTGPGSFTGIRVGVATAKMLGFVWNKKIAAVSSLEAAALAHADGARRIAVLSDARRGKVYAALFEKGPKGMRAVAGPLLTTSEEFGKKTDGSVQFLENPSAGGAAAVARAALAHARTGRMLAPDALEPLYLHPKDCHVTKK